jgi:phage terminase large subunit
VEEGINFLKGYRIVVHPRCEETINELSFFSYATDKDSGKVLPELEKNQADHCIDALRYACEGFRLTATTNNVQPVVIKPVSWKWR